MEKKIKVCFAASSGGHFEQLMCLEPLMDQYDSFILTEQTEYSVNIKNRKVYYVSQINRKEKGWMKSLIKILIESCEIAWKEKPDVVICTGVLAMIPMCLLCKAQGGKLIYIESYAKVSTPTETGKLLYRFADEFYVQWKSMLKIYPKAKYLGGIY